MLREPSARENSLDVVVCSSSFRLVNASDRSLIGFVGLIERHFVRCRNLNEH
jgi:hypothetical protein